jgi:Tfp pilus assembly protein PilN
MPKVNLVPKEERAREYRRQLYIVPVGAAIAIVGALGISFYYYNNQLDSAETQLKDIKSKNEGLQKQVAELDRYQEIKNKKQTQQSVVSSLYGQRIRWSRTLDDLAFVIPEDVWLISIKAKAPGAATTKTASGSSSAAGNQANERDVQIEGYTYEMTSVAVFIIRLGLISSLSDVTLTSAEKVELSGRTVTNFKIAATYKQTGETTKPTVAPTSSGAGTSPMTTPTGTTTTPTGSTTPTGTTSGTTGTTR